MCQNSGPIESPERPSTPDQVRAYQARVLAWYDHHQRQLPWRARPGDVANPYHVWLSEIMLQQTTVPTVMGYFQAFIERWPSMHDLAAATLDDVLHAWQGLGYYARARNLHKCAQVVVAQYDGTFPQEREALLKLPGIGPYTAAAILSIAFQVPDPVMDGNIERIMARLFMVDTPLPMAKKQLYEKAAYLTPNERPGDYAQALMDLASSICTPTNPKCGLCPMGQDCKAYGHSTQGQYPVKMKKALKPTRYGTAYWIQNTVGKILIRKRPSKGLLAGLMEVPTSDWVVATTPLPPTPHDGVAEEDQQYVGDIRHTFTHFHLVLHVVKMRHDHRAIQEDAGIWVSLDDLERYAFPTLMKKVIRAAVGL